MQDDHVCYAQARSFREAMREVAVRHPNWWLPSRWLVANTEEDEL